EPAASEKPPAPFPSRIVTLLEPALAVARSGVPSWFKSPTATEVGLTPTATGELLGCENPPAPSPRRIVTLLEVELALARSGLPSRSKSPTATEKGPLPTATGEPEGWLKRAPHPLKDERGTGDPLRAPGALDAARRRIAQQLIDQRRED